MVEDLDRVVLGAGLREELPGGGEGLAGARGGAEAGLRVRLEEGGHDLPERFGNALGRARSAVGGEVLDECLGVGLGALQEVQRDQANGEQVGGEVRFGAQHLLGGEIARRAHDQVGLGQPWLAQPHRDAEVGQPQPRPPGTGGLEQDVGRLDVPVDHALGMHRGQPREELVEERADERRRQGAVVPDQMDQRAAGDQVHGEQDLVVVRGPAGRRENMGVVDPQSLLADEAQQGVRVALEQDLRCHIAAAPVVPGTPDGTHASASDRIGQFVPAREHLTHDCASLLPLRLSPLPAPR
ncbi:hypothetical protein AQJ54_32955 [Streptomyces griseorubiginosus]|uniref:Uncharacterized protein n=1 Tax=Streptomyces griseorubiginosus TaxID=67304 RepID=A0A101RUF0_9ACTN|nr:hypothetical protein AQJ54_32955 [Streptomyces griseorubiginosus]